MNKRTSSKKRKRHNSKAAASKPSTTTRSSGAAEDTTDKSNWAREKPIKKVTFIVLTYLFSFVIGVILGLFWGAGLGLILTISYFATSDERDEDKPEPELFLVCGVLMIAGGILYYLFVDEWLSTGPTLGDWLGIEDSENPPTWFIAMASFVLIVGIFQISKKLFKFIASLFAETTANAIRHKGDCDADDSDHITELLEDIE